MTRTSDLKQIVARTVLAALASIAFAGAAIAAYPETTIRMIVPWPPGGATDVIARIVSKRLSERLGQAIVIDNRAGASGMIGTEAGAKSAPDGYTLMTIADSYVVSALVSPKIVRYDPRKDFTEIGLYGYLPFVFVVNAEKHGGTFTQFIEEAKKHASNPLTFSSWGVGSSSHLAMEMLMAQTGARMMHVPFQGAAPALVAVLGRQVDALLVPLAVALPQHRSGKAKILGVAAQRRFPGAPDLPTTAEQGVPAVLGSWVGMLGPAKTPADVVARLSAELKAMSDEPQLRETLIKNGLDATYMTPQEFTRFVNSEYERQSKVIREANIKTD